MSNISQIKRLKIAEQIIIVSLFAVLVPFTIAGFVINNVNQQSVRAQLCNTATIIANSMSDSIDVFNKTINFVIDELVSAGRLQPCESQDSFIISRQVPKTLAYAMRSGNV